MDTMRPLSVARLGTRKFLTRGEIRARYPQKRVSFGEIFRLFPACLIGTDGSGNTKTWMPRRKVTSVYRFRDHTYSIVERVLAARNGLSVQRTEPRCPQKGGD